MSCLAVILYEDQRGTTKDFGLHALVLACVADELSVDVYTYRLHDKFSGRPMKGVGNLLASCRRDVPRLGRQGQRVYALIDDDHIREQLRSEGLAPDADDKAVIRAIKAGCVEPDQLEVILLKKNAETIVEAAAACDKQITKELLERAALKKETNARDRILHRVANNAERNVRDCIRRQVMALEMLVSALRALVPVERSGESR